MKHQLLNYHHLLYFWIVSKEGTLARAAERLGVTSQTISEQLGQLEKRLGKVLFAQDGRKLALTDVGRVVLGYADQIFLLGERLQDAVHSSEQPATMRLAVGTTDSLPKLVTFRLLQAVLQLPGQVRLSCFEGEFDDLIADLAVHRLDVVFADRAAHGSGLRVFSHLLGEADISVFGAPALAERYRPGFPRSLHGAPMLLPTRNTAIRSRLDYWFESHDIVPLIRGEFEDSGLLTLFGRSGVGLFPALTVVADDVAEQVGAQSVGEIHEVREQLYALSTERRIKHPAVEAIRNSVQAQLFRAPAVKTA